MVDPESVVYRDDLHSTTPRDVYTNYTLLNPKRRFVGYSQAKEALRKIILHDPTMLAILATARNDEEAAKLFRHRFNELVTKTMELPGTDAAFEDTETVETKHGTYNPDMETAINEIEKKILAEERRQRQQQQRQQQIVDVERRRADDARRLQERNIQSQRPEETLDNSPIPGGPALSGQIWNEVMLALAASEYAYHTSANPPPAITDAVPIYDVTAYPQVVDGFVGWWGARNTIVIGFKGTDSARDAITDVNAFKTVESISEINSRDLVVPLEGHRGFIGRFLNLLPQVLDDVNALLQSGGPDRTKMLITGHSLGGALATVAAIVLAQFYPQLPIQLITFEAPRSITTNTLSRLLGYLPTKTMEENAIRISCKEDPVPNVPTQNMHYAHVGKSFYITDKIGSSLNQHRLATVRGYLERYGSMDDLYKKEYMPLTNGRGKVSSKKGTDEMRKRMAYARSFRKPKMK